MKIISQFLLFFIVYYALSLNATPSAGGGYKISSQESFVLDKIIATELQDTLSGKLTMLHDIIEEMAISSEDLATAYERNEIEANQLYLNKYFIVKGIISAIDSGIDNEPVIRFRGINSIQQPQARFFDSTKQLNRIATLRKGNALLLYCKGNGETVGIPLLSECEFTEKVANDYSEKIRADIKNRFLLKSLELSPKNEYKLKIESLAEMILTVTNSMPEKSACHKAIYICSTELIFNETSPLRDCIYRQPCPKELREKANSLRKSINRKLTEASLPTIKE